MVLDLIIPQQLCQIKQNSKKKFVVSLEALKLWMSDGGGGTEETKAAGWAERGNSVSIHCVQGVSPRLVDSSI